MKYSIVTTLYYSAPHFREFYQRMASTVQAITEDYEMIFVNDGSPDQSLEVALDLQKIDPRITVIDLSRNFGHHRAIMAGLSYTRGDQVFLIDCDLEEEPETLARFVATKAMHADCDVVYGVQPIRKGSIANKVSAYLFYKILNFLSHEELDPNMVFSRLMSRRYVDSLLRFNEAELFLVGIWKLTGYVQIPVVIPTQHKGASTYTLSKKIDLAINAVTSFSNKPLVFISHVGAFISGCAGVGIIYLILMKIFRNAVLSGWTSLMISVWLIGGMIIFFMGIIGIYISKIFVETKARPLVIVKREYRVE